MAPHKPAGAIFAASWWAILPDQFQRISDRLPTDSVAEDIGIGVEGTFVEPSPIEDRFGDYGGGCGHHVAPIPHLVSPSLADWPKSPSIFC
jgi:hypothetical protein